MTPDPRIVLGTLAGTHLGVLALTESYGDLPAATAAYGAAWCVTSLAHGRLEREETTS